MAWLTMTKGSHVARCSLYMFCMFTLNDLSLLLVLAYKLVLIITAANRAFFRPREDLRRVGERSAGVWR